VDPALVVFGLGVGVLVGMTGIGGGSLMTPLLILVFGINPLTAVGTDLAYGAVTKTVGAYKHWRQRTVDFTLSTWMAVGSVPAAIGGVYVLDVIERAAGGNFDNLLITVLAGTLLLCGVATLARAFLKRFHERERAEVPMERRHKIGAVAHVYAGAAATRGGHAGIAADAVMEVRTGIFGLGKHYYIPIGAVTDVTIGGGFLRKPQTEFDAAWQTKPDFLAHPVRTDDPVTPERLSDAEGVTPHAAETARTPWTMANLDSDLAGFGSRHGTER